RSGAQLARPVAADRDDAHAVAVLLAEEGHRAERAGLVERHDLLGDLEVLLEARVDALLDLGERARRHGLTPAKVETDAARSVLGTGLRRVLPERLLERLVDEVGPGVGTSDRGAARDVDRRLARLAEGHGAVDEATAVDVEALDGCLDV